MPTLNITVKYRVNTGIILTPAEVFSLYLYGIDITSLDGEAFSDSAMEFYIRSAQREVENFFNLRFKKQLIEYENTSYYRDDYWQNFPIIRTRFPVEKPLSLIGMLNNIEQIIYPESWLRSNDNSNGVRHRRISVVPTGASTVQANANVILTGITSQLGMQRFTNIPDYWDFQYTTGFDLDDLPYDLINVVGKIATFGPLGIAGDLILGAGIAGQSLSVDGLSQSISSTASATSSGYNARLLQYERELKATIPRIKLIYDEIKLAVL